MSVRALSSSSQSQRSQQPQQQASGGSNSSRDRLEPTNRGGGRSNMRETIHSGHFMVSDFEPESEAQDEEYEVGMPIPPGPPETVVVKAPAPTEPPSSTSSSSSSNNQQQLQLYHSSTYPLNQNNNNSSPSSTSSSPSSSRPPPNNSSSSGGGKSANGISPSGGGGIKRERTKSSSMALMPHISSTGGSRRSSAEEEEGAPAIVSIDGSLTKLFQCMSLAYRQKLTSPKWNRFKGVRLRWKDKIRLNNVIWRCWHMQFIMKKKTLVCQFASPLDVDGHNKAEAVVMEGKYWKRKLSTVAAEYKKWRLFYRNRIMGWTHATPPADLHPVSLDGFDWSRSGTFGTMSNIIFDDDMFMDFTDTLFSSLSSNQPFAFPNPREIARAGMVADFIQPGLVQLQPNLDDFMDTLEPLQDYVNSKLLPPVPEELENFDPPPDSLLSEGLLHTQQNNGNNNQGGNHNNHSGNSNHNHHSINHHKSQQQQQQQQQQSSQFYDQGLLLQSQQQNGAHHHHQQQQQQHQQQQHDAKSRQQMLLQQLQLQQQNNHQQAVDKSQQQQQQQHHQVVDVFAKPQGKPRGRSRSGNGGGGGPRSQQQPTQLQQLVNNANSNTLLSHLLSSSSGSSNNNSAPVTASNLSSSSISISSSSGDYGGGGGGGGGALNMILGTSPFQSTAPFHLPSPNSPLVINFGGLGPNSSNNGGGGGKQQSLLSALSSSSSNSIPGGSGGGGGGGGRESVSPPTPRTPNNSGPSSPTKGGRNKSGGSEPGDQPHRGAGYKARHINAEQKRRCNIKNGFDTLHSLIPALSQNPNAKVSKAAMLAKGAEYIRQLKGERAGLKEEIEAHRAEVEALNGAINSCQSLLPATGAPVSRQRTSKMNEMFHVWVRERTLENWKFWLFSTLIRPLLDSYNSSVSTASVDEMCRTVLAWVDQHCSLVDLRPAVLTSLRQLCTTTDILSNPANLQEEAYKAVNQQQQLDRSGGSDGGQLR